MKENGTVTRYGGAVGISPKFFFMHDSLTSFKIQRTSIGLNDKVMYKWYKRISLLMVITIFSWAVAGIINSILSNILYKTPSPQKVVPIATIKQQPQPRAKDSYEIIATRNLMGLTRSGSAQSVQQPAMTGTGVILKGTITGPDSIARAIVEVSREQRLYRIGDIIGGAELTAVFRDHIVMKVNGQQQVLALNMEDSHTNVESIASTRYTQLASASTAGGMFDQNSPGSGIDFYDLKRAEGLVRQMNTPIKRKPRGHEPSI
jgi:type II secretory pathway component PulC